MPKKLFLVGSPPACGKTHISKILAKHLSNPVYLDKDALIPLSKQAYVAANEPYERDTPFFKKYLRDAEYEAIIDVGIEALEFNKNVIINAPFSKEFRDVEYMKGLQERVEKLGAVIVPIWVKCEPELSKQRMLQRNSDRDTWKLSNWDDYLSSQNYDTPDLQGVIEINTTSDSLVKKAFYSNFRMKI